jgi:putative ABC transport system permease protein
MSSSETLVAGQALPERYDKLQNSAPVPISIEVDYAARQKIKLVDLIRFEIMGEDVNTRVQGFRRVEWRTFEPNFFIQFPPGVLDEFPKSWIGVVFGLEPSAIYGFQSELAEKFPNLTAINLAAVIERVSALSSQLAQPIIWVSMIGLLAVVSLGLNLVLFQVRQRRAERWLYQQLGATIATLSGIYTAELGGLLLVSLGFGLILGNALSIYLGTKFFSRMPSFQLGLQSVAALAILAPALFSLRKLIRREALS